MKAAFVSILLLAPCLQSMAAEPAAPAAKAEAKAPAKEAVVVAAITGAEFNRLRESKPEFQKAATVEAAVDLIAATSEATHKALNKADLAKHRKEVLTLLLMQDGKLTGAPALNLAVAGAKASTVGAKVRRNAQTLVANFSAARAAGSTELEGVKNLEQAVAFIRTGVTGSGPFATSVFKVALDDDETKAAKTFILFDEATASLKYDSEAVLENETDPDPDPPAPDAVAMIGQQLKMQTEMETKRKAK